MEKINIEFKKLEKPISEDKFKEEYREIKEELETQEKMQENERKTPEEQRGGKIQGIHGIIIHTWDYLAPQKGLTPLTEEEKEYLTEGFKRFEENQRVKQLEDPKIEALLSLIIVFGPKILERQLKKNNGGAK